MAPQPAPLPFIPKLTNLRIFALGLLWVCLGGIGPLVYEIWDAKHYEDIDWAHVRTETALSVAPLAIGYWRKYKALISPPPQ